MSSKPIKGAAKIEEESTTNNVTRVAPICNHPKNPSLGEPCEMNMCGCGQNAICPVCGWGFGNYPCDCNRHLMSRPLKQVWDMLLDETFEQYNNAWERLAES